MIDIDLLQFKANFNFVYFAQNSLCSISTRHHQAQYYESAQLCFHFNFSQLPVLMYSTVVLGHGGTSKWPCKLQRKAVTYVICICLHVEDFRNAANDSSVFSFPLLFLLSPVVFSSALLFFQGCRGSRVRLLSCITNSLCS